MPDGFDQRHASGAKDRPYEDRVAALRRTSHPHGPLPPPPRERLGTTHASRIKTLGLRFGEPFVGVSSEPIDKQTEPFMDGDIEPP
jgi:hypothetical protein